MFSKDMMTPVGNGVQAKFDFGKYILSVVQNDISYGRAKDLFEIGVFKGDDMVELPGITAEGDTVRGFLTENDVSSILIKMATISGRDGKLVE